MKAESPENLTNAAPTYWVVAQVKSNRVVYFTDDPGYRPPVEEDWYYVSSYQGPLPGGMTLRNCWRWRFNGGVFKDAGAAPPAKDAKQLLVDQNRKALLRILRRKIDGVRVKHAVSCRMGTEVRKEKLREARELLAGRDAGGYPFLTAVAAARDVPLADAASLIVQREQATADMLLETEKIRERFKVAIHAAQTPEELQALRESLMGDVYPQLSDRFAVRFVRTKPLDRHRQLSKATLAGERIRLRAQLKVAIDGMRAPCAAGAADQLALERKVAAARRVLQAPRAPAAATEPMLASYARANGIPLREAACRLVEEYERAEKVLLDTEALKDALLAEIDRARTEHHLGLIVKKLKSAAAASLHADGRASPAPSPSASRARRKTRSRA